MAYDFYPFNKTFGAVSDTHYGSYFDRPDAVQTLYSIFESEGIQTVFHAGNIVDGYLPKINGGSVYASTIDDQVQIVIDDYPKRKGVTTYFITGDDHEGWWQKEGFNFGHHLVLCANSQGRSDLVYAGHIESDFKLDTSNGHFTILKLQHPGGGSAYARSYAAQKQIESFEGGEKPAILVQGHYHVSNFMPDRNVYAINLPGLQDQTIFARKKRLRFEVGGAIIRIAQNPCDGSVQRCSCEFIIFFDRGYYKRFLKSDEKATNIITI